MNSSHFNKFPRIINNKNVKQIKNKLYLYIHVYTQIHSSKYTSKLNYMQPPYVYVVSYCILYSFANYLFL